jgi:hypothetical protein
VVATVARIVVEISVEHAENVAVVMLARTESTVDLRESPVGIYCSCLAS